MPTTPHPRAAATPWPVNLSAYRTALTGAVPGIGAMALLLGDYTGPEQLLAAAITAAGQLAVLFTARPWLKAGYSWVTTALAALALVLGSYEGDGILTWSQVAQWDFKDVATILVLVVASVLHTAVPNAPSRYALPGGQVVDGAALATSSQLPDDDPGDVTAPPLADTDGAPVVFTPVNTSVLAAVQRAHGVGEPLADGTYPRPGRRQDRAITEAGDEPTDEAPGRGGVHL